MVAVRLVMTDGSEGVARPEALGRLAKVGVSLQRAAARMAVEDVGAERLGSVWIWPERWVAQVETEAWADLAVPAVVVKCRPRPQGPAGHDVYGREWVGLDLGAGPSCSAQLDAVRMAWPLSHQQRAVLGDPDGQAGEWTPPDRWLFVVAAGGWVPPGYVWALGGVERLLAGRFAFGLVPADPAEVAAYSGRWVPTRSGLQLVDLVPGDVDTPVGVRLAPGAGRARGLLDRVAGLADDSPVMEDLEAKGWLTRILDLAPAELDELEQLLDRPSPPSPAPPSPPRSPAPAAPAASATTSARPAGRPAGRARPGGTPRRRGDDERWRAPAAVLDGDRLIFDDGEVVVVDDVPVHYGQVAELAARFRLGWGDPARRTPDPGQIWMTGPTLAALGLPAETPEVPEAVEGTEARRLAAAEGWQLGAAGGWQRVWRKDGSKASAVAVAVPWLDGIPLTGDNPGPVELAGRLRRFAELVGMAFRVDPGATGSDLAQMTAPKATTWTLGAGREAAGAGRRRGAGVLVLANGGRMPLQLLEGTTEADYVWTRPSSPAEGGWVHCYDRGGSYLAALSPVWCGVGDPVHVEGPDGWDGGESPGYWRIDRPAWAERMRPCPVEPCQTVGPAGTVWVTTPTMRRLAAEDVDVVVHEGWVWAERSRVFRPTYDRLRDARAKLIDDRSPAGQAVLATVKACYTRSIGWLARSRSGPGQRGWRPDWRHHIIAQSRVGIDLVIADMHERTGRSPVVVANDALWIRSPSADGVEGWPGRADKLGRGLGQYRWLGAAPWERFEAIVDHRPFSTRAALAALAGESGEG